MTDNKETKENKVEETKVDESKSTETTTSADKKTSDKKEAPKREFTKNKRQPRRGRGNNRGPRSEFDQKILDIRRVTRVSKGGRKFSFSVSMVIGNKKGKIGIGTGKAGDTSLAIQKATRNAEKNTIQIKMTKNNSIPHEVSAKYNSARVLIIPAKGRGIIAGSALRDIIELAGLKDINGKILSGSKNKLNISKAVFKAFSEIDKTVKSDDKNLKKIETKKVRRFNPRDKRHNRK